MKTVFFDVDTQADFVYPAGALYVPGAQRLLPVWERLAACAASRGIPLISTADAHEEDDPEFRHWPPHCVKGTLGQRKPSCLLLPGHAVLGSPGVPVPAGCPQVIVEKQTLDAFESPSLAQVLADFAADRFLVYGVVTEYCVRLAALGLLRAGKQVELVTDAIQSLSAEAASRTFEEFTAAGGMLTTSSRIFAEL